MKCQIASFQEKIYGIFGDKLTSLCPCSGKGFVFICTGMYSEYRFAFLVSRQRKQRDYGAWDLPTWVLLNIVSHEGAHINQWCCGRETMSTESNIFTCWRHIWHTRSKEIFCKNSMHYPKYIKCIEQTFLFCTVSPDG